jgi:hypothetical protein
MSASPGTESEYSRGSALSRRLITPGWAASGGRSASVRRGRPATFIAVVGTAVVGALVVIAAQFATLYDVKVATSSIPVKTLGTGANHAYAPLPLALLAIVLALAAALLASRPALVGLVALGVATLLIALIGDLPDTHATGLIGSSAGQYVKGASSPSAGLYMETLGAVLLLVGGGVGFLMLTPARPPARREPPSRDRGRPGAPRPPDQPGR